MLAKRVGQSLKTHHVLANVASVQKVYNHNLPKHIRFQRPEGLVIGPFLKKDEQNENIENEAQHSPKAFWRDASAAGNASDSGHDALSHALVCADKPVLQFQRVARKL